MKNKNKKSIHQKPAARVFGYFVAIVVNIILLNLLNNLPNWNLHFLTDGFTASLWLFNLSLAITIVGNILFIIYDDSWFKNLVEVIINTISFIALYSLFRIFPFDLSGTLKLVVETIIIISILTTFGSILIHLFKLSSSLANQEC